MSSLMRGFVTCVALAAPAFGSVRAQDPRRITGQVTESGTLRPLAGAQVVAKGTGVGVLTDAGGRYALTLPAGRDSITFTLLGYATLTRAAAPVLNVTLGLEAVPLAGLAVTALGIEREQRALPYAARTLAADHLPSGPSDNALTVLQGQTAGLVITQSATPGGTTRISLRGSSSLTGNNEPLLVLNGVPIDNSTPPNRGELSTTSPSGGFDVGSAGTDIDLAEIESITVLKGPNAAALYGSRAANGAIEIRTRTGKGLETRGSGVSASIGGELQTPLRLPDYQDQYGQGSQGEFDFVDGWGGGRFDYLDESWGPKLDGRTHGCVFAAGQGPKFGPGGIVLAPATGVYDATQPCNQFYGPGPWVAHPNNVRSFFRTGMVNHLNVAVARASERSTLRFSVGHGDEQSMYPTNRNLRTDVGLNGGVQLSGKLSAEAAFQYVVTDDANMAGTGYDEVNPMMDFVWFGRQVDTNLLKQNVIRSPTDPLYGAIVGAAGFRTDAPLPYDWNPSFHTNPYFLAEYMPRSFARNRLLGQGSLTYRFNNRLSVTARTGRDWYYAHTRIDYPVNTWAWTGLGGLLDDADVRSESNTDVLATLKQRLNRDLGVNVNAGGNMRRNEYWSAKDVVSALILPGLYTLENSDGPPSAMLYRSDKRVNSLYAAANADYKGWLSVDLTGRNDWSSTLPRGSNSYFYPSIGAAVQFADALGIEGRILSSGKLRASWTRVGNDTDPYLLAVAFGPGPPAWGGLPGFTVGDTLANAALKPERTIGVEAGTDLGFFADRVVLNATVYRKSTNDQIFPVLVSQATGFKNAVVNTGKIENRGVELEASLTPAQLTNGFSWTVTANWSRNLNRVVALNGNTQRITLGQYWHVLVTADQGDRYGNLVGRTFLKDSLGRIVVGNSGLPLADPTLRVLGNFNPDWQGGITNTFRYKRLSLSVLLDGQKGGNIFSVTKWFGQYSGVLQATLHGREIDWCSPGLVVPNSVHRDGTPNTTRVCPQDYWENTFYSNAAGIIDASYLKLRDMRLAIDLPPGLVRRAGFSRATFALIGHNLYLWARQKTIDPETAFDTSNRQGVEFGQFPTARTVGFTLTVRP